MATETTKITYVEGAAPSTPAASRVEVYAKADGLMYSKDDAGAETLMSSGGTATRASLGLATSDSPEFAALNVGAATDTTITRTGAGEIAVEGNRIFRVGGADVPIADGGTGASTATAAFDALSPMTTAGDLIIGGASGTRTRLAAGTSGHILTSTGAGSAPSWQANAGVADILDIPTAETDDTLVLAPDGAGGVEFRAEAGGGGGGLGQSFVGYNTVGGTWTTVTSKRQYCKKITLANAALVTSVDAYIRPSTDNLLGYYVSLLADNSNAPGVLIAAAGFADPQVYFSNSGSMPGAGRWFSVPLGAYVPSGDYWICVFSTLNYIDLANDGSGSDVYFTTSTNCATGAYPSAWALNTGTVKYSIRASILS